MPSASKLIAFALTGTGIAGAGAGTYYYSLRSNKQTQKNETVTKSKISQLIGLSKRTILQQNDNNNWDIKVAAYVELIKSLNLSKSEKEGVKEWCQDSLEKVADILKINEENSDYQKVLKLCTTPTNKEKLLKNQKKIAGKDNWAQIEQSYKAKADGDVNIPTINDKSNASVELISKWCDETLDKEVTDTEYNIADKWCTFS